MADRSAYFRQLGVKHSGLRVTREDLRWITRESRRHRRSLTETLGVLLEELRAARKAMKERA